MIISLVSDSSSEDLDALIPSHTQLGAATLTRVMNDLDLV